MRILIVDDDKRICESTGRLLEAEGYTIMLASTFREAVDLADADPPDVVLSDWQLAPGPDGLDLSKRFQDAFSTVVVLMSGRPLEQLEAQAQRRKLRVAGCLRKPFKENDLLQVLRCVRSAASK